MGGSALHGVLLTARGRVYTWGEGKHGCLGQGEAWDDSIVDPALVPGLHLKGPVVSIACGHAHTCALSLAGDVYTFGWNKYGQLGLDNYESAYQPHKVPALGRSKPIQIAAGWAHTALLLGNGEVMSIYGNYVHIW